MKKIVVNSIFGIMLLIGCNHSNNEKIIPKSHDTTIKEKKIPSNTIIKEQNSNSITKNLSIISLYRYKSDEDLDIDSLGNLTANQLVASVNKKQVNLNQFAGLTNTANLQDKLSIYSFYFDSGGTRGMISCPILQWKSPNGLIASNISEEINCDFKKIIQIDSLRNLYLLIGQEKGDGSCNESIVYVIQLKNNKIDLKYSAFEGIAYLRLCNGIFTYDEGTHLLNFRLKDKSIKENLTLRFDLNSKIYKTISSGYNRRGEFSLKYNEGYFH